MAREEMVFGHVPAGMSDEAKQEYLATLKEEGFVEFDLFLRTPDSDELSQMDVSMLRLCSCPNVCLRRVKSTGARADSADSSR